VFLSINRYERKKNIQLAIEAYAILIRMLEERGKGRQVKPNAENQAKFSTPHTPSPRLIIAGGYDERVSENVEYSRELESLAYKQLELKREQIEFIRSFTDAEKTQLLASADCVLYTPENEHFGIVPIESMAHRTPVIARDCGGPKESITDEKTGFLCGEKAKDWAMRMIQLVKNRKRASEMGEQGRLRVENLFSYAQFRDKLNATVRRADQVSCAKPRKVWICKVFLGILISMLLAMIFARVSGAP